MSDNEVACKHCGCMGLHWIRVQTAEGLKAMLANKNEAVHSCLNDETHIRRDRILGGRTVGSTRYHPESDKRTIGFPVETVEGCHDHAFDVFRYQIQSGTKPKTYPWQNTTEQKETNMDFTLIHCNQTGYVALEVKFENTSKPYIYKAEASDGWRAGDHAVVMVDGSLKIVSVSAVHDNPIAHLENGRAYNWIVQKINMSKYASRSEMQDKMIEQLRVWESQRKVYEAAEAQAKLIAGLPGAEQSFAQFKSLGSTVVEISL